MIVQEVSVYILSKDNGVFSSGIEECYYKPILF